MALARLISKNLNLGRRVVYEKNLINSAAASQQHSLFCTTPATDEKTNVGGGEVAVTEKERGKKKGRRGGLWKNNRGNFAPSFNSDLFPSSLGNALMQATDNINKLLHNFSPSRLIGRVKDKDDHYKIKFQLPGLEKEDVKITVEHGMLRIVGEHKEEDEEDDEHWASSFGYYDTTLALPEDAKVDEIKAEMKHGVLTVIIPKSEGGKTNVKEVEIN